ncbi:MAG: hypothetical protein H0W14_02115 [Actinobacteria bacterium]|nr:hypothetical protein [Actinomycetota bacterium]
MSAAEKAHVSRLYFLRGLTQREIGDRLGVSRFKVARLLEEARAEGIVRIEIADDVPQLDELAAELERAFRLELAIVTQRSGDVPRAAAALLPQLLRPDDVVGVAWGETLRELVELLPTVGGGQHVVQICGAIPELASGTGPSEVALELARRLGGGASLLPAPAETEAIAELRENPAVRPTVTLFDQVTVALVGIGAAGGGGYVLTHTFDDRGTLLDRKPALALSLERPRLARVIAAAGGPAKREAVRGALRSGLLDVLVTDETCARFALAPA